MTELSVLLKRYGQTVELYKVGETQGITGKAFLQSLRQTERDWIDGLPTPLGEVDRQRLRYIGPAELDMSAVEYVKCNGRRWRVRSPRPSYVGDGLVCWWAMLTPEGETQ